MGAPLTALRSLQVRLRADAEADNSNKDIISDDIWPRRWRRLWAPTSVRLCSLCAGCRNGFGFGLVLGFWKSESLVAAEQ